MNTRARNTFFFFKSKLLNAAMQSYFMHMTLLNNIVDD